MKKIFFVFLVFAMVFLATDFAQATIVGPNSPVTNADDSSVGTIAWTNRDNDKISDNLYATTGNMSSGSISYYLKTTNFGFSVPTGATINGISVEIERFGGDPGFRDNAIRIVKNGAIGTTDKSSATAWASADPNSYVTYGGSSDLWGETWTNTDINNTNFGFAISVKKVSGAGKIASIDHIRITVNYTANNPIPTTTGISPTSKTVGASDFTLTVNGTNFISSSVVNFAGSARATTFVSDTQLTAVIPSSDLTTIGTFSITVTNSPPGGGTSNNQTFTVNIIGTTADLNTSGSPSTYGTPVTFTAIVSPASGGAPSGTVTFNDGAATIGTETLNGANPGVATFTTSTLSVAGSPHPITATYGGDPTHSESTSDAVLQSITNTPVEPPRLPNVPGAIAVDTVPEPIGPTPSAPAIPPPLSEGEIGSPGTTTADLSILGGLTSLRPIKATPKDIAPPTIEVTKQPETVVKGSVFSLSAYTIDTDGVIEFIAYSIDGGKNWQPVTIAPNSKIGMPKVSFDINSFNLPDGNYEILLKARDNSENETIISAGSVILDALQPQIISLLLRSDSLEIPSVAPTEITLSAKLNFEIVGAFNGGVTQGEIVIDNKNYDFIYNKEKNNWTSKINIDTVGQKKVYVNLFDGVDNKLHEEIFSFNVTEPFSLNAENNQEIVVFEFNYENDAWQVFDAKAYQKNNPVNTNFINKEGMMLPAGKYYIQSKPTKKLNIILELLSNFSNVFTLDDVESLSGDIKTTSGAQLAKSVDYSSVNAAKIFDNIPQVKNQLSLLRGDDIILFNLDPRSFVSLEQLSVMSGVQKSNPKVQIFATTNKYYLKYCQEMLQRGNYQIELISTDDNYFYKNIFEYRSPGFIFINRRGEVKMIESGYLTKQEIIDIIGGM